ncbi:thiamine transporter 2-like [Pleurodeles waltl]|uniref:thiamine transporter 2-like n=1 Tax=Pleurodeles waltl TaxID=8319 RepID=UPI0037098340
MFQSGDASAGADFEVTKLESYTVAQLRQFCKNLAYPIKGSTRKEELQKALGTWVTAKEAEGHTEKKEEYEEEEEQSIHSGVVGGPAGHLSLCQARLSHHIQQPTMSLREALQRAGWVYPTTVICVYGFFINLRPAEPFLTPYLTGSYKNFTVEQVMNGLYPIWTYSFLAMLLPIFLITDICRYKPTIVLQGVSAIIVSSLLCFAQGIPAMQYLQFTYGVVTASEVAYFSYIYSVVGIEYYQKVTSYCRSITLVGYTMGAILGQLLVSLGKVPYFFLNTITLGCAIMALFTSLVLPMPSKSLFEHGFCNNAQTQAGQNTVPKSAWNFRCMKLFHQLWWDFKSCYSSKKLIYWSLWWSLATCGYYQVFNYVQVLWDHVESSRTSAVYNGGVEAAAALIGALATFAVGYVKLDWSIWGELALSLFSAVSSGALYLMDFTSNIWASYAGYVIFKSSHMLLITIAMFQIAANLSMARYALVFGINTFVALVLQTILTAIVVDSSVLGLDIVTQVKLNIT